MFIKEISKKSLAGVPHRRVEMKGMLCKWYLNGDYVTIKFVLDNYSRNVYYYSIESIKRFLLILFLPDISKVIFFGILMKMYPSFMKDLSPLWRGSKFMTLQTSKTAMSKKT
jgi:hypothetical protein